MFFIFIADVSHIYDINHIYSWLQTGSSGMAVAEMGVPTGFDADLESITKHDFIKKIETQDRKVIFYFDQVGNWKG